MRTDTSVDPWRKDGRTGRNDSDKYGYHWSKNVSPDEKCSDRSGYRPHQNGGHTKVEQTHLVSLVWTDQDERFK